MNRFRELMATLTAGAAQYAQAFDELVVIFAEREAGLEQREKAVAAREMAVAEGHSRNEECAVELISRKAAMIDHEIELAGRETAVIQREAQATEAETALAFMEREFEERQVAVKRVIDAIAMLQMVRTEVDQATEALAALTKKPEPEIKPPAEEHGQHGPVSQEAGAGEGEQQGASAPPEDEKVPTPNAEAGPEPQPVEAGAASVPTPLEVVMAAASGQTT